MFVKNVRTRQTAPVILSCFQSRVHVHEHWHFETNGIPMLCQLKAGIDRVSVNHPPNLINTCWGQYHQLSRTILLSAKKNAEPKKNSRSLSLACLICLVMFSAFDGEVAETAVFGEMRKWAGALLLMLSACCNWRMSCKYFKAIWGSIHKAFDNVHIDKRVYVLWCMLSYPSLVNTMAWNYPVETHLTVHPGEAADVHVI